MTQTITRQKKQLIWTSRLLILLAAVLIFFVMPKASAAFWGEDNTKQVDDVKDIMQGCLPIVTNTIFGGTGEGLNGGYSGFYTYITGGGGGFIHDIMKVFIFLGGGYCFIIAGTHLMQRLDRGEDMSEAILKLIIEITIVLSIIANSADIIAGFDAVGQTVITEISGIAASDPEAVEEDAEEILEALTGKKTGNMWWRIAADIALFLPKALNVLVKIAAKFCILQLLFELALRQMFTPFFIADIYQEGVRSAGARHLKKYLAVYLKLIVCIVVSFLGTYLITTMGDLTGFGVLIEIIAINFTCVGIMFKSGEYVNGFTD